MPLFCMMVKTIRIEFSSFAACAWICCLKKLSFTNSEGYFCLLVHSCIFFIFFASLSGFFFFILKPWEDAHGNNFQHEIFTIFFPFQPKECHVTRKPAKLEKVCLVEYSVPHYGSLDSEDGCRKKNSLKLESTSAEFNSKSNLKANSKSNSKFVTFKEENTVIHL